MRIQEVGVDLYVFEYKGHLITNTRDNSKLFSGYSQFSKVADCDVKLLPGFVELWRARKTEIPLVSVEDKLFKIRWAGIIQYTLPIYEQHNDYQFDRVIRALCVEVSKLQSR